MGREWTTQCKHNFCTGFFHKTSSIVILGDNWIINYKNRIYFIVLEGRLNRMFLLKIQSVRCSHTHLVHLSWCNMTWTKSGTKEERNSGVESSDEPDSLWACKAKKFQFKSRRWQYWIFPFKLILLIYPTNLVNWQPSVLLLHSISS